MTCKVIFLFLLIIHLSSQQCQKNKTMKWCINSAYVDANNTDVAYSSCKIKKCIVSTCPYGMMNYRRVCVRMETRNLDFSEITALYRIDPQTGKPVRTNKTLNSKLFQVVTYKNTTHKPYLADYNNCTSGFETIGKKGFDGHFLEDGSFLLLPAYNILPPGEYVVRFTEYYDKGIIKPQLKVKFAKGVESSPLERLMDKIFAYVMLVSFVFMTLVVVVYVLCKDLRTTAGLTLMTYVTFLALTFFLILVRDLCFLYQIKIGTTECYILSTLLHFVTFSSYMWMNIMGLDIWWTLRNVYYGAGCRKGVDYRKFKLYCCIASIPPLIYVIIEVCIEEFAPDYGPRFKKCTVCSNKWYLAGLQLPLQSFNFIPFVLTVFNLWRMQRSNRKQLDNSCSGSTGPVQQNAILSIKISVMMGTNWFMDVMLLIFYDDLQEWFIYAGKMYNALFGVILFAVYIFKSGVLLRLFKRLSINNSITKHLEKRVSRRRSSNRSGNYSVQSNSSGVTVMQSVNLMPDADSAEK